MKNKLSILVLILSSFISSCSKNVESKQPKSDSMVKQATEASKKVVKITWSYCGGKEKILSAKEDGCVRSAEPVYFWMTESGVTPKGILIKRGLALGSPYVEYEVAILGQGCFPKDTKIQPLDFYSVPGWFSLNTKVVGNRKIVDDLVLDIQPLSREGAYKILSYYKVRPNVLPPACDALEAEREILAPYSPKQLGTISN
jgi:hypothetical protein